MRTHRTRFLAPISGIALASILASTVSTQPGALSAQAQPTSAAFLPVVLNPPVTATTPPRRTSTPTPRPSATAPAPTPTATGGTPGPQTGQRSIRFYGQGATAPWSDRLEIPYDGPTGGKPINVGATDFTLEFWMKGNNDDNYYGPFECRAGRDVWLNGTFLLDNDVYSFSDAGGDFGVSILRGRIAFGLAAGNGGDTACGTSSVIDDAWHHVALQRRRSDGRMQIFVDGKLEASVDGPDGDSNHVIPGPPPQPGFNKEHVLVFAAEKNDLQSTLGGFKGFIDELRISNVLRYSGNFARPSAPFTTDANTVGLYHFDEVSGTTVLDTSGAAGGPSHGELKVGGNPAGPVRSTDSPF
jgi:hypothetical protein